MSVMQRNGSRPIGIIIAVVVIALCVYGAVQLASTNDTQKPAPGEQVATTTNRPNQPVAPTPTADKNPTNTTTPTPADSPRGPSEASPPDVGRETDEEQDSAQDRSATGREAAQDDSAAQSLPSTGPAGREIASMTLLIILTHAYFKSRRQLSGLVR